MRQRVRECVRARACTTARREVQSWRFKTPDQHDEGVTKDRISMRPSHSRHRPLFPMRSIFFSIILNELRLFPTWKKRQFQVLIKETNNRDLNCTRRDFLPSRCQGQSRRSGRSKGCWSETRWSCCKNGLVRTPESGFFSLFYWQRKITKKHL